MTAAMSVSDIFLPKAAMAVPGLPLVTILMCAAFGPFTILEPSSDGNAFGTPLPFAWWHAMHVVEYTFSPRARSSASVHFLFGSSAAAADCFFCSATQAVYLSGETTSTTIG